MPTIYSDNYPTGNYTYTRVRVDYSGTSGTAILLYSRTNDFSGETSTENATFSFGGASTTFTVSRYGRMTDSEVARVNFNISRIGGWYSGSTANTTYFAFSGGVTIPSQFKLYGSVNGQTKNIRKLYGSVNGQTKAIKKLYGSVNGQTKRIF